MSRARAALVLAAAVAVPAAAGCGGGTGNSLATTTAPHAGAGLQWQGTPHVFRSRGLPHDRVVIARVRNAGTTTLHLVAARVRVRDARGRALQGSAGFTTTFAHGLYGVFQQPASGEPVAEQIRLGKIAYLPPGGSAPFYAAWRMAPGAAGPVRVDYGAGTLALPAPQGQTAR